VKNIWAQPVPEREVGSIPVAGEAYIDAAEVQPVRVFTKLSRRIPLAVRSLLGTEVPAVPGCFHLAGKNSAFERAQVVHYESDGTG